MGLVEKMRGVLDAYPGDRLLIGEIYLPLDRLVAYYGPGLRGAQMPFNFLLIGAQWSGRRRRQDRRRLQCRRCPPGAWPNWVLSNHDKSRIDTRIGPAQARVAAMMLLTLRGTPTIYYGEEIGMLDTPIPPDRIEDPSEKRQPGLGLGRDPGAHADAVGLVAHRRLHHGPAMAAARRPRDDQRRERDARRGLDAGALQSGSSRCGLRTRRWWAETIEAIAWSDGMVTYERRLGAARLKVVLNLTAAPRNAEGIVGRVLLSTTREREGEAVSGEFGLGADEGLVIATRGLAVYAEAATLPQKQCRLP